MLDACGYNVTLTVLNIMLPFNEERIGKELPVRYYIVFFFLISNKFHISFLENVLICPCTSLIKTHRAISLSRKVEKLVFFFFFFFHFLIVGPKG